LQALRFAGLDHCNWNTCVNLVKKFGLTHFIGVADALIAATVIENKILLYTDNISDC
jgi:predicted nucleic acid-binding protein